MPKRRKTHLTATAVERMKANPDKRIEIPDGKEDGLYLVVQPSGRKTWALRYRHGSRTRKLNLGKFPDVTLADARDLAGEKRKQVTKGIDPAETTKQEAEETDRLLVKTVAAQFLERYAKKNKSWKDTEGILRLYVKKAWGHKAINEVTKEDVARLLDKVEAKTSVYRRNRVLACVRKMMNWAVANYDEMLASPMVKGMAAKGETPRERYLVAEEVRAVWQASEAIGYPFGRFCQLLLSTGQRRGEVLNMVRGANLDVEAERLWTLTPEETKARRLHFVPLSDLSLEVLDTLPEVEAEEDAPPYVFTTNGRTHISGVGKWKVRLDQEIEKIMPGMAPWRLHDLRRTVATHLEEELGFAPHEVGILVLNHDAKSYKGITAVYTRGKHMLKRRRLQNTWARYLRLMLDEQVWRKVADHLRPKESEREDAAEARLEEFQDAIQTGGETWDSYLKEVAGTDLAGMQEAAE